MSRSVIIRFSLFLILFLMLSSYFGPGIVGSKLLYPFYFFIYGNIGKILLFSFLSFLLLSGKKIFTLSPQPITKSSFIFMGIALILTLSFPILKNELLKYNNFYENILLSTLSHLVVISIPIFIFISLFGFEYIKQIFYKFRNELIKCITIGIILYFAIFGIWGLWPFFSGIVLKTVSMLFGITHENVVVFPPRTLFVKNFAVTIDEACSGLESLLLFSGLSSLILYTDRKKINKGRFVIFYILGLFGTFIVNILRVYGIIWSGLIFSPHIASTLFHTYLGMVLFLIYFILILKIGYKRILKK